MPRMPILCAFSMIRLRIYFYILRERKFIWIPCLCKVTGLRNHYMCVSGVDLAGGHQPIIYFVPFG